VDPVKEIFLKTFPNSDVIGKSSPNYWVIPSSGGDPRWIVPTEAVLGFKVLNQWYPFGLASRFKWECMLGAYRLGHISRLPYIKPLHLKMDKLNFLHTPIFYIGTPTSVQKMVITLINPATQSLESVIKFPLGEKASGNILNEAYNLSQIETMNLRLGPALRSYEPDGRTSVQEAISGRLAGFKLSREHFQTLRSLRHGNRITTLAKQCESLQAKSDLIQLPQNERQIFQQIKSFLADDAELPAYWLHGDFSPWNIVRTGEGLRLVDWERAEPEGLPLMDFFHYLMMQQLIRKKPLHYETYRHPLVLSYLKHIKLELPEVILKKLLLFYFAERWLNIGKEISPEERQQAFQVLHLGWETLK
jgi:hypothetical protein